MTGNHDCLFLRKSRTWLHSMLLEPSVLMFSITLISVFGIEDVIIKSLVRNSIITFQHILIKVRWEEARLLWLLSTPFSGLWRETSSNDRALLYFKHLKTSLSGKKVAVATLPTSHYTAEQARRRTQTDVLWTVSFCRLQPQSVIVTGKIRFGTVLCLQFSDPLQCCVILV